ncbi:ABC transporter substrate-binding protein [Spirochaeta africana]|uniref:ABC-type nitrate/sulfonate/bicarbonate transport system, periplasmic component n=1 Tax=Spirochaeta africana (strain ATCC 700263 / DSM 8902 / Z-7692) TaxID=889378 RepID=H9ULP1_SPIAZ|nr:ABC transporter substrate-binding protein [Spirochaeta africana]AFG38434.1 hypothetical protein Spiaf_2403 [Spirochaeta africana DSM 8902]
MKTKALLFLLILSVLTSGLVFAAGGAEPRVTTTGSEQETAEAVQLRLGGLKGPTSVALAPYIVQPDRLGDGVRISTATYASPDLAISQILAGEVDIVALPTNLASVLYNRDADIQLLGVSGGGVLYLVADREMELLELTGQTVHTIARGATPDIMLQALTAGQGLHAGEDYTIQYAADQTELAQNLIAGRVGIAVLPEPFVTRVTSANPDLQIAVDLQEIYREQYALPYYPMTSIIVRGEFARQNPAAVRSWLADMPAAQQWLSENLPEAASAAGDLIGIPGQIIQAAFPRLNLTWIPAAEARTEIQTYLQIFADFNPASVGGKLPEADFYFQSELE